MNNNDLQIPWTPKIKGLTKIEALLSRGFLRSRPEKWFPGFKDFWSTFSHSLGLEIKLLEIKPVITSAIASDYLYLGHIGNEKIQMAINEESATNVINTVSPGATSESRRVILEYLFCRFFSSVSRSWSGPEAGGWSFIGKSKESDIEGVAAVKCSFMVNSVPINITLHFSEKIAKLFDVLWKKQLQTSSRKTEYNKIDKNSEESLKIDISLSVAAVTKQEVEKFLQAEEALVLNSVDNLLLISLNGKPWLNAILCEVEGKFAFEIASGGLNPYVDVVTEEQSKIFLDLGSFKLNTNLVSEISQAGAVIISDIPVSNKGHLKIGSEKFKLLKVYESNGKYLVKNN